MIDVLIVDDSKACRAWLSELLAESGEFRVVAEAGSGGEAVELLDRIRPDVVVLDLVMPDLDGLTVARRIMEHNPLPIVVLSGQSMQELSANAERLVQSGVITVMAKPASLADESWRSSLLRALRGAARSKGPKPVPAR